jgi:hypothetical protein
LLASLACGAAAIAMGACGAGWEATEGVVTDRAGAPIGGAQVVVLWSGARRSSMHSSSGECVHVQGTQTGADGRFKTPAWRNDRSSVAVDAYEVLVYKRGFAPYPERDGYGRPAARTLRLVLQPAERDVERRLIELNRGGRVSCAEAGVSRRNATDYYRAMNPELKELLATPEGQRLRAREEEEREKNRRTGLGPFFRDAVAFDRDATIESLAHARDGELYEPVQVERQEPTGLQARPSEGPKAGTMRIGPPASK